MKLMNRVVVAAVIAAMAGGCASSGGGSGQSDNPATAMGCVMLAALGLLCNQWTEQQSEYVPANDQPAESVPIERTPDNTPAQPLTTWSERAGWKVEVPGLTTYVQYRQSPPDPDESARRIVSAAYQDDYWSYDYEHETVVWYDTEGKLKFAHQFGDITDAGLAAVGQPGIDVGVTPAEGIEAQSPFASLTGRAVALMSNPHTLGWEYQTFGVWNDGGNDYVVALAETYGTSTPGSAVPTSGSATFTGKLGGFHVSAQGQGSIAAADISVSANFSTRALEFASSGTVLTRDAQTAIAAPELNLRGTLAYQPGASLFTGSLQSAGGTLTGPTKGRFYGPAAQELGGIFTVQSSTTVETFVGAYGAKR